MESQRHPATCSRRAFLARNAWAVGLALAACGSLAGESRSAAAPATVAAATTPATKPAAAAAGTVDFMGHFTPVARDGSDPRADAMAKIEEDFKQSHPDVTIWWQQTAFQEMADKFLAGFAANTAPDICLFASDGLARVNQMGALGDMLPHFKTWPQSEQGDFPKGWWDIGMSDGKKVAAPLLFTPEFVIYRKSAVDSIGAAPSTLRTWDAWLEALKKIVVDGTGKHWRWPRLVANSPNASARERDPVFDAPVRAYLRMVSQAIAGSGSPDIASPVPTNELLIQALQKIVSQNVPVKDAVAQAKARYDKLLSDIPPDMLPKS